MKQQQSSNRDFNKDKRTTKVSWGNKVTHINQDESIIEHIDEFKEVLKQPAPPKAKSQ
jgi:hypothetical protein